MRCRGVVICSIRTEFARQILDGTKRVEIRRRPWRICPGSTVLVYSSGEERALVGSFVVESVEIGAPEHVWARHHADVGISKARFDQYLSGAPAAVAILTSDVRRLENPIYLSELRRRVPAFIVPQSFRHVYPPELSQLLNGEQQLLLPGDLDSGAAADKAPCCVVSRSRRTTK